MKFASWMMMGVIATSLTGCSKAPAAAVGKSGTATDRTIAGDTTHTECEDLGVDCGDYVVLVCCNDTECAVAASNGDESGGEVCDGIYGEDGYCDELIQSVVDFCASESGSGGDTGGR